MSAKREGEKQRESSKTAQHEPWKLDSDKYPVNWHSQSRWMNWLMRRKLSWGDSAKITENEPDKNLSGANDQ